MNLGLVQEVLKERGLAPSQKLGQNFLIDEGMRAKIISAMNLSPDDRVLEVGPGLGAMTWPVCPLVKELIAVEYDQGFVRYLIEQQDQKKLENLRVIHKDILEVDFSAFVSSEGGKLRLLGNMPYQITGPLLIHLIKQRSSLSDATLMMQREVAQKILAGPGSKQYGRLAIYFELFAEVSRLSDVPAGCYYPRPKVDSAVLQVAFPEGKSADVPLEPLMHVLGLAFRQRRKMIGKSLQGQGQHSADFVLEALKSADIDPKARPEQVSVQQFARLCRAQGFAKLA